MDRGLALSERVARTVRSAGDNLSPFRIGDHGRTGFMGTLTTKEIAEIEKDDSVDFIDCNTRVWSYLNTNNESDDAVAEVCNRQTSAPFHIERLSKESPEYNGHFFYGEFAGEDVDIYVFDTGVNADDPEFEGRVTATRNFSPDGPTDVDGHGSHVAGTITTLSHDSPRRPPSPLLACPLMPSALLAVPLLSLLICPPPILSVCFGKRAGVAAGRHFGIAKKANVISVKVLSNDGSGLLATVIKGMQWALDRTKSTGRRSVFNFSLGGARSKVMNSLFTDFVDEGLVIVVAAGNDNDDACKHSPASASKVITVGATTREDVRADFSNYGTCIDVFAPGVAVESISFHTDMGTKVYSGTSQAAPLVAGLAAMILSANGNMTTTQVTRSIQQTAIKNVIYRAGVGSPNSLAHIAVGCKKVLSPHTDDANAKQTSNMYLFISIAIIGFSAVALSVSFVIVFLVRKSRTTGHAHEDHSNTTTQTSTDLPTPSPPSDSTEV